MCNMENLNSILYNEICQEEFEPISSRLVHERTTKNSHVKKICEVMGKQYNKCYKKQTLGFNYYEYKQSGRFVCFLSRNLLMQVSQDKYRKYARIYENHGMLDTYFMNVDESHVMIVREKNSKFRPQIGFIQKCMDTLRSPFIMLENAKMMLDKITSKASKLLFLDIMALLLNLREGYLTATKLLSVLLQLYTIHARYVDLLSPQPRMYTPQAGTTLTDLILGFSLLGLPSDVLNAIKTFTALTGKRVFESELFLDMAEKLFTSLIIIVKWVSCPFADCRIISEDNEKLILGMLEKMGTSVFMHRDIKTVCDIYTKYIANPQVLFDPTFRQEIMTKYNALKTSPSFLSYVQNSNNKYFATTWNLFESNVVKSCQAFDTSGRDEPICFVFEGEAGSGKSCIMNSFVALLKESGMTTICHSVPAAEDGKDFYDDYENQDVFVMDDVGQQGKSQWRYLINYVSPVKYPLPCATASKKNTKFFNSKIVLCTTNHFRDLNGFTSSDCISEPEALYRRAHVININRGSSDHFSQDFSYYKYDHINSKVWENKFINHTAVNVPLGLKTTFTTSDECRPDNTKRALSWLYAIFKHVVKSEKNNNASMNIDINDLRDILEEVPEPEDRYYDVFTPQSDLNYSKGNFYFMRYVFHAMMPNSLLTRRFDANQEDARYIDRQQPRAIGYYDASLLDNTFVFYYDICKEFVNYYIDMLRDYMSDALPYIVNFITELGSMAQTTVDFIYHVLIKSNVLARLLLYFFAWYIASCFCGEKEIEKMPTPEFTADNIRQATKMDNSEFEPQTTVLVNQHEQWIKEIRKHCKTMVVRDARDILKDEHTQCVVSGRRILIPAHLDIGNKFVDLYHSWDHYKQGHVEIENVQLKLVRKYVLSDLAVYEIKNTVPLYKLNRAIFPTSTVNARQCYLINSCGYYPVIYDKDIMRNDERVQYSNIHGKFDHPEGSGFFTPFTASGACGTVLAAPGSGIIGFHVAGSAAVGFCVQPPSHIMAEIRELMMDTPAATNFDIDEKIIPNFSGSRLRYEGKIDQIRALGDTSFKPSPLHKENCEEMRNLISNIEERPHLFTETPIDKIDEKAPPNFHSKGTPAQTLKMLSRKTFMKQGRVTDDEIQFIKSYLRTVMIPFTDLEDKEVAFGGEYVPALNKDSSNGYGCLKDKEAYFDFVNKEIRPEAYQLINRVLENARVGNYDYNDFMCRETFKDELRKSTKVGEPRTFRVMPLGHIWWTKKIFGQLLKHFKNTRMETGISVGFNPYLDADKLAKKLKLCKITGDADFGKWDGTILAIFIIAIMEVLSEFYQGDYPFMIEWLSNTIATSFVLVNDEIMATTHGLPSGTWLTLLLNCLLNKCLTALVIYRYKPNPCVDDVHAVVDFVTGDDKIFGADDKLAPYFNLLTIRQVTESLGMDCTNGDKSKITKATQDFDKLTYVKRHFRMHPRLGRYVGCLSLDTIMNTLQWIDTTTEDTYEAMVGKMRSMQIESYLHSPTLFAELTRTFENNYPFEAFFDENRVLRILEDPAGYDNVVTMHKKNYNF